MASSSNGGMKGSGPVFNYPDPHPPDAVRRHQMYFMFKQFRPVSNLSGNSTPSNNTDNNTMKPPRSSGFNIPTRSDLMTSSFEKRHHNHHHNQIRIDYNHGAYQRGISSRLLKKTLHLLERI